jgi:UDP-glucose 4-epimerase
MSQVVLVTGVAGDLGRRFVAQLSRAPGVERAIGVDVVPPRGDLGLADFVRADIRNPVIAKVIVRERVDTVVHTSVAATPAAAGGRPGLKELNVIGTMQLLAACQRSAAMRKVVVRSSAAVYGSSGHDPAVFTETDEPVLPPASGYAKDAVEVEGYVRGLARRRSDLTVSVLRFANFLGPRVDSPLSRYFHMPVVATVLGFDPRLQFIHEDDGVEVLRRMAVEDHPGTFNVAGDGVVLLSQALRRGGRPILRLPAPVLQTLGDVGRRFGGLKGFSPELLRWLTYGRVLDTDLLARELSWRPKYSSEEAFTDFADSQGLGQSLPLGLLDRLTSAVGGRR